MGDTTGLKVRRGGVVLRVVDGVGDGLRVVNVDGTETDGSQVPEYEFESGCEVKYPTVPKDLVVVPKSSLGLKYEVTQGD